TSIQASSSPSLQQESTKESPTTSSSCIGGTAPNGSSSSCVHEPERATGRTAHCSDRALHTGYWPGGSRPIERTTMAAAAEGGSLVPHTSALCAELVRRAATIAHGDDAGADELALSRELTRRIEEAERRACSLAAAGGDCEESRRIAAVDFIASVATT